MENLGQGIATKHQALSKYAMELTKMAAKGNLKPVIGREHEIEIVVQILCKKRKNNACLIGDPGVGKFFIAAGVAQRIVNATVPQKLQGKKIFYINWDTFIAGTKLDTEIKQRLNLVIDEVKQSHGAIILFFNQLHNLIGNVTKKQNAANMLKVHLAKGEIKCFGTTRRDDYKKFIEKEPSLGKLFQVVEVPEPSIDETIKILRGLKMEYERYHNVRYGDEALITCANLSKQYIRDDYLPHKGIDLMDQAGSLVVSSQVRTTKESSQPAACPAPVAIVVTSEHIKQVISSRTGIPIENFTQEESARLLDMVNIFRKNIIGQDEAIQAVSRAIRRARVGLRDPTRPIASFLFTGPTGVGKTQVAKVLALEFIGSKEAIVRLDMSEYMERHSVARLFGSPPGYIGYEKGGQLTEAILRKPHSVILLDEIEKAHVDVFNTLLQILDDGRLTDGKGQVLDFKQTIIIMTSNIGFSSSSYDHEVTEEDVAEQLKKTFRPEFLNRLDEIIIFNKLEKSDLMKVLDILLEEVRERIQIKNISLEFAEAFKEKLFLDSCGGFNSNNYGARPLRRVITRQLEDRLTEDILNGNVKEGDSLIINANSEGQVFVSVKLQEQRKRKREPFKDFSLGIVVDCENIDNKVD